MPCSVTQACSYVTLLSDELAYTTILTYYQSGIFMHVCAGLEPVRCSHPVLLSTLNGIKRSQEHVQKGKDPIFPAHLRSISRSVDKSDYLDSIVFVAALLLFRTLLRVSHVVLSDHTLTKGDVKFNGEGCLIRVNSSKTSKGKGKERFIPVTWSPDKSLCPVLAIKVMLKGSNAPDTSPLFVTRQGSPLTYSVFS